MSSLRGFREVWANAPDEETVVVYQAYSPTIALPALEAQRFVAPFSRSRMTWIKPFETALRVPLDTHDGGIASRLELPPAVSAAIGSS